MDATQLLVIPLDWRRGGIIPPDTLYVIGGSGEHGHIENPNGHNFFKHVVVEYHIRSDLWWSPVVVQTMDVAGVVT